MYFVEYFMSIFMNSFNLKMCWEIYMKCINLGFVVVLLILVVVSLIVLKLFNESVDV